MSTRAGVGLLLAVAMVGCGAPPVPSAEPTFQTDATPGAFEDDSIAFEHPPEWRESTFDLTPMSHVNWFVFLSTDPLGNPCRRAGHVVSCGGFPVRELSPGGVLINWAHWGFPGWELDPTVGEVVSVGGRRATIERRRAAEGCGQVGGEREIIAQIEKPEVAFNWLEMTACLRGPNVDTIEAEIDAMLASVRWITPVQEPRPLPTGPR